MSSSQDSKTTEKELRYGFCGWQPACLQGLNKPVWFLVFMFLAYTIQSFVANGLVGVVLTTLEKRFELNSWESSWIAGVYDLAAVPTILLASYVGTRPHRPFWVGMGQFAVFVSTVIFLLPHFTTDPYMPGQDSADDFLCDVTGEHNRTCEALVDEGVSSNWGLRAYLGVFIVARIMMGIGCEPLFTFGVTFMDDIVARDTFSFYIALCYVGGTLGPALAYIAGGYVLTVFTEFYRDDIDPNMTESDPRWVGAWWLNFVAGACGMLLVTVPFFGYARDLPGAAETRAKKVSEAHTKNNESSYDEPDWTNNEGVHVTIREIPAYLRDFVTNVPYMMLMVLSTGDMLLVAGFTAFGPKYLETQFNMSAAFGAMLFGIITIPGGVGGLLIGGYIIKRFQLLLKGILKGMVVCGLLTVSAVFVFLAHCDSMPFAGINTGNYSLADDLYTPTCVQDCQCGDIPYSPVCGDDNVIYFSPCHAGCGVKVDDNTFTDCGCMSPPHTNATAEICASDNCVVMPVFMVVFLIAMFFLFCGQGMSASAVIRSVPTTHRALAIGFQSIVARLLGGLGGPLVFGLAFDQACDKWDNFCERQGFCLQYNSSDISLNMFLLTGIIKLSGVIAVIIAWRCYKPPPEAAANSAIGEKPVQLNDANATADSSKPAADDKLQHVITESQRL